MLNSFTALRLLLASKGLYLLNLVGVLCLVLMYKPYCREDQGSFISKVCVPCPPNSICSLRSVMACSRGYTLKNEEICIKDDETHQLAYKLSLAMKEHLEYQSYLYECIGEKNVSEKVGENDLFTMAVTSVLDEEKSLTYNSELFDQAFDLALELISENAKLYQIAIDAKERLYSYKFHYWGSCLFNTLHGKKAHRVSNEDMTVSPKSKTITTTVKRNTRNTVEKPTNNNTISQEGKVIEKEKEIAKLKQLLEAKEKEIAASVEKTHSELVSLRKREEDIRTELKNKENELSKIKTDHETLKKKEQELSQQVEVKAATIERLEKDLEAASQKKEDDFF
ncbi:hypothetical protein C9374_008570 [Naegleria lovaniensis]|uniref:Man1/Src1-like C-terminal domain-containing protein n=1 Tax=Naegleria lovaniensis TaxID=51637 RepID=A0AA88GKS2_NAELO|nr:uncharacterized protein C9374_008570 [Naegleria lovaniensis]KAG2377948.1 hypothetical protein C9374_008570 [Naegleria lovaniensis]